MKIKCEIMNPLVKLEIEDGKVEDMVILLHGVADYLYTVKRQGENLENRKPDFDLFVQPSSYPDPVDPLVDEGDPLPMEGSVSADGDIHKTAGDEFAGEDIHGEGGQFMPINDFAGQGC
tara:strand:+ start:210 stop:566 length:357 start_codon:yes stop_codon:yes gene_type:complete